jgi:pimeloyl-ACP methyl ester carboxylesterase
MVGDRAMATFILVHGAFHGAWCWFKLIPELEKHGHLAIALDLPGAGDDSTPAENVTLDDCVVRIVETVSSQAERVYLVAHSLGGMPASIAADLIPKRLRRLVYVSAAIPRNGDCFADIHSYLDDPQVPRAPHFVFSNDRKTIEIVPDVASRRWYNGCTDADIAFSLARCKPMPASALTAPIHVNEDRFGGVSKSYIHCSKDKAIPPALQDIMTEIAGCRPNFTLPTGHSPFLSAPALLADMLVRTTEA